MEKGKHGGHREGAGRKLIQPTVVETKLGQSMVEVLTEIALGKIVATTQQVRAAIEVLRIETPKLEGKKAERQAKAEEIESSGGKYAVRRGNAVTDDTQQAH